MSVDRSEATADPLAWAQEFSGVLAERAATTEAAGTPPIDLIESLRRAGLFSLTLPRVLGGAEAASSTVMSVVDADGNTTTQSIIHAYRLR